MIINEYYSIWYETVHCPLFHYCMNFPAMDWKCYSYNNYNNSSLNIGHTSFSITLFSPTQNSIDSFQQLLCIKQQHKKTVYIPLKFLLNLTIIESRQQTVQTNTRVNPPNTPTSNHGNKMYSLCTVVLLGAPVVQSVDSNIDDVISS